MTEEQRTLNPLPAAMRYTRRGWPVLPLINGGKLPATEHGFYDASTDETRVKELFNKSCNIAIRVGPEANLIVIDPDNKGGKDGSARLKELEEILGPLPATYAVETRYGKHFYFKYPKAWLDAPLKADYAPGLDIKFNGYVVAPPSNVGGFLYMGVNDAEPAELPDAWVKRAIKPAPDVGDWERARGSGPALCDEHGIKLSDVIDIPPRARRIKDGYLIKHPEHGATGSGNLSLNMSRNLWYCFRHNTGGDPVKWVAVREGLINCADADERLDRDTFLKVKDALRREGLISDESPTSYKENVEAATRIIEAHLGRKIGLNEAGHYAEALRYLHTSDNAFLKYCVDITKDYHALDSELTQTILLSTTRMSYSSVSALNHLDCTGKTGAGKNDLVNRCMALLPPRYVEIISTASPTVLYYATIDRQYDDKGKLVKVGVNKERYKHKIICITEVSDAAGYSALKALAEIEESEEHTHMATVMGKDVTMTITGPRCVITTSVEGVKDEQVKRRFIHTSVSEDSADNKLEKLKLIQGVLLGEKDIRDDPRVKVACAGIDLIFANSAGGVVFEPFTDETTALLTYLNELFLRFRYSITNIKQYFTLCQCLALWKRFERDSTRIEVSDLCEAWFLLSTFERETITKTTREGIAVLKAILDKSEEYDLNNSEDRPARGEIVKASGVGQAQVYRLLSAKPDETGKLGELLELGYVAHKYADNQTQIELTVLGEAVLKDIPKSAKLEGYDEPYEPIEPIMVGKPLKDTSIEGLQNILKRYADPKGGNIGV